MKGAGAPADNTRGVISPALSTLLGVDVFGETPAELATSVKTVGAAVAVTRATANDVGIVNFYRAFRNVSLKWLRKHHRKVWRAFSLGFNARNDGEMRKAYALVAGLPSLPRPRAGNLPPYNLLTPVLACPDARGRSPILNARKMVRWRLRQLGLARSTLVEQFDGLSGLIGQSGFEDACVTSITNSL